MTKIKTLAGAGALILMSTAAFAAPCATGTTVTRDKEASKASTVETREIRSAEFKARYLAVAASLGESSGLSYGRVEIWDGS